MLKIQKSEHLLIILCSHESTTFNFIVILHHQTAKTHPKKAVTLPDDKLLKLI